MIDSYCNVNDAYSSINKNEVSLDHMARQINNNKKKNRTDIYNQFRKASDQAHKSIEAFNNLQLLQNDKGTSINKNEGGFYSAQGEYAPYVPVNKSGTLIKNQIRDEHILDASSSINIDTPSNNSDFESYPFKNNNDNDNLSDNSDSYDSIYSLSTISTDEIDKHIKTKSKFNNKTKFNHLNKNRHHCIDFDIDSADSLESLDSGESLLKHIKSCQKCKEKVIDLINKDKNSKKCFSVHTPSASNDIISESSQKPQKMKNNKTDSSFTWLWSPEIKEIITICLFGFLIIIMLDLLMRK